MIWTFRLTQWYQNKTIPVISRLNKNKYNGIPKPNRALTAKYRPVLPKPRPTTVSASSRTKQPQPSQLSMRNSIASASSNQRLETLGSAKLNSSGFASTNSTKDFWETNPLITLFSLTKKHHV